MVRESKDPKIHNASFHFGKCMVVPFDDREKIQEAQTSVA